MSNRIRRLSSKQKLQRLFGSFPIVMPCYKDVFVYHISPKVTQLIEESMVLPTLVKSWLKENVGDKIDDFVFFDIIEEDTHLTLSALEREELVKIIPKEQESIHIKQLSMLQMMEHKTYPSELTSFVTAAFSQKPETKEAENINPEGALAFHQWVVCMVSVSPRFISLERVVAVLNGKKVEDSWFYKDDLERLHAIRDDLRAKGVKNVTEANVRELKEFKEELWLAHDDSDPERMSEMCFVEDFVSDNDLVFVSGLGISGPQIRPGLNSFPG